MAEERIDYDKQYQEDLERAQALSLESLALEQFNRKKRLQGISNNEPDRVTKGTSSKLIFLSVK